jgi:hypothetical protein
VFVELATVVVCRGTSTAELENMRNAARTSGVSEIIDGTKAIKLMTAGAPDRARQELENLLRSRLIIIGSTPLTGVYQDRSATCEDT